MAQAPNCGKIAARARLRRSHHIGQNKEDAAWNKTLESNKYPKCVGKKLFEDCPEALDGVSNTPHTCKICSQYVPTKEERRARMMKLMAEIKR